MIDLPGIEKLDRLIRLRGIQLVDSDVIIDGHLYRYHVFESSTGSSILRRIDPALGGWASRTALEIDVLQTYYAFDHDQGNVYLGPYKYGNEDVRWSPNLGLLAGSVNEVLDMNGRILGTQLGKNQYFHWIPLSHVPNCLRPLLFPQVDHIFANRMTVAFMKAGLI